MTATKKKYWTLLFKPKVLLVIQKLWFMSEENRTKENVARQFWRNDKFCKSLTCDFQAFCGCCKHVSNHLSFVF